MTTSKVILLAAFTSAAQAGWIVFGGCPKDVQLKTPFDVNAFSGRWYSQSSDWQFPLASGWTCGTSDFRTTGYGSADLKFGATTLLGASSIGGKLLDCNNASNDWTCQSTMGDKTDKYPFSILDTDYNSYSVIYGCYSMFFGMGTYQWIGVNTRSQNVD